MKVYSATDDANHGKAIPRSSRGDKNLKFTKSTFKLRYIRTGVSWHMPTVTLDYCNGTPKISNFPFETNYFYRCSKYLSTEKSVSKTWSVESLPNSKKTFSNHSEIKENGHITE